MHKAIAIIYAEHRSLSAVLSGLNSLARLACDPQTRPDFAVLRAMVYCIDAFPERLHHPKEDAHLFAKLVERDPGSRELVELLKAEHVTGARLVRELELALHEFEAVWPQGAEKFAAVVASYLQFHWMHMRREEQELLPRAERALTSEDWLELESVFAANNEPIADLQSTDFKALFQRILHLAPAPVGLGERWSKQPAARSPPQSGS